MIPSRSALDNQALGYWRGSDYQYGGSGSGMGTSSAGTSGLTQGMGGIMSAQAWHPTILYMLALIVGEMIVFGVIGRILR